MNITHSTKFRGPREPVPEPINPLYQNWQGKNSSKPTEKKQYVFKSCRISFF